MMSNSVNTTVTRHAHGITFPVDRVEPASAPLAECKAHQAVQNLLESGIESCSDYHGSIIADVRYHALLAAVYTAFNEHRPLVLAPDVVWITIAQGVAQHMAIHAERLRYQFVSHAGKETLAIRLDHFHKGSPENPWHEAFAGWTSQIREHVGADTYDTLTCNFSTTGPVERAASEIVLMDIFERYFHYEATGICGIPAVTLEGEAGDWQKLRDKLEGLRRFDLDWWLEHLWPICDEFVRAASGRHDTEHWRNICKLTDAYGGHIINGWIAKLFPYLREYVGGPVRKKNPIFDTGDGFQTFIAPSGLSCVPFVWKIEHPGKPKLRYDMEAIGGLLGIEQDRTTHALRPKVGWAVRDVTGMAALLNRLEREHQVREGRRLSPVGDDGAGLHEFLRHMDLPSDLGEFYHRTDGAILYPQVDRHAFEILPAGQLELVWGPRSNDDYFSFRESFGGIARWYRFCLLADGSFLAIDFERCKAQPLEARKKLNTLVRQHSSRREHEMQRIRREMERWRAAHTKQPSQRKIRERESTLVAESDVLREIDDLLRPAREEGSFYGSLVILCREETIGIEGACPIVAQSFTEFLTRALESDGKYWWTTPEWEGYGDAVTRLKEG